MFPSTAILSGTVVVEGVAFRWSVTEGLARHITVTHPELGTRTQQLTASPESQARTVGRAMLSSAASAAAIGYIDAVDEAPLIDDDSASQTIV